MLSLNAHGYVASIVLVLVVYSIWDAEGSKTNHFDGENNGGVVRRTIPRDIRAIRDQIAIARGFGKRANAQFVGGDAADTERFEFLRFPDSNSIEDLAEKMTESFPVEWFAEAMHNNPTLAKTILRKFVDINGDGRLTPEELLRPTSV